MIEPHRTRNLKNRSETPFQDTLMASPTLSPKDRSRRALKHLGTLDGSLKHLGMVEGNPDQRLGSPN